MSHETLMMLGFVENLPYVVAVGCKNFFLAVAAEFHLLLCNGQWPSNTVGYPLNKALFVFFVPPTLS